MTLNLRVDLDLCVNGVAQYVEGLYGIKDVTVVVSKAQYCDSLLFSYNSQLGAKTYTQSWYTKDKTDPKRLDHASRDITSSFIHHLETDKSLSPAIKLFVEVLIGKYKGSIGFLTFRGINLGNDPVTGQSVEIPMLSVKNLKFQPEATHTHLQYEKVSLKTKDSFGNTNDIGDIIVYVDNGRLNFGIYIEDDVIDKRIVLKTTLGKHIRREYLKLSRDMMNVTKMPSSKISTQIFKAQLTAE